MIQTNLKDRNAVLLAVITPLCYPVSWSRLHRLILSESVYAREGGEGGEAGRQTGEWDHYLGDGGRKEGGPLVLVCERRPVAFPVYINVLILN